MQIKTLYRTTRPDGGTRVSLDKPEGQDYTTLLRLVADEGKALTQDNKTFHSCIDVESSEGWSEVDYETEPQEEEYA